jgi:SPFH domain / Band 7 family
MVAAPRPPLAATRLLFDGFDVFLGVVLFPHVVVTVPSGHVGVLWRRFGNGTVVDPRQLRNEGLRGLLPWNLLYIYDLRLQSMTDTYNAISSDGVSLTATMNVRFRGSSAMLCPYCIKRWDRIMCSCSFDLVSAV